jgi:hypothetical protein
MKKYVLAQFFFLLSLNFNAQTDSIAAHLPNFKYRPLIAVSETVAINVLINRYDAWVRDLDWAKVTPSHWYANLHSGFDTDGDAFSTNFFAHPYHGSLFFNAARKNGNSFWGSIPYVLAGSWTWEYFGETYPPSEIDWNTTTLGGVYLGEITHRLTNHLLRNDKKRGYRFIRNLTASFLDPIGQINGLFYQDVYESYRSVNTERFPLRSQFSVGFSRSFKSNLPLAAIPYLHMNYSIIYGDLFNNQDKYHPFDFFILRAWLDINSIKEYKKNYFNLTSHAPLWKFNKSDSNLFTASGHYAFIHNNVFKIGALSFTLDYNLNINSDKFSFLSALKLGPVIFGSANSEVVEVIEKFTEDDGEFLRDYVYGKGYMFELEALILQKNFGRMIISFNNWVIYTQRDTPGTERNSIFKLEYYYPIWKNWGLGVEFFRYHRAANYSNYEQFQDIRKSYSEVKFLSVVSF